MINAFSKKRENLQAALALHFMPPRRALSVQRFFTGQNTIAAPPHDAPELMEILEEIQGGS